MTREFSTSATRAIGILGLAVGIALVPVRAAAAPLDRDTQKCIQEANKSLGKVAKTVHVLMEKCIQAQAKGKEASAVACIAADAKGKIQIAAAKAVDRLTNKCAAADPGVLTDFFGSGTGAEIANALNDTADTKESTLLSDFLGSDIDAAVAEQKKPSVCQQRILKTLYRCQDTKLREFERCKKQGLRSGVIMDPATLRSTCLGENGTTEAQPDPALKIFNRCGFALAKTLGSACEGLDISTIFPGPCSGAGTSNQIANCLEGAVECRVCEAINGFENTARDCDEFDDADGSNDSCPLDDFMGSGTP